MAYIAGKPVRFDRNYSVGERIPDSVIDPRAVPRLINMGRIIRTADDEVVEEKAVPVKEEKPEPKADTDTTVSGVSITGGVVGTYTKPAAKSAAKAKPKTRKK